MINFESLKYSLPILSKSNLLVSDLIVAEKHKELIEQYPSLNFTEFKLDASHISVDHSVSYQFEASEEKISKDTIDTLALTPTWKQFISILTGKEYINKLSDAVEIDLTAKEWLIDFGRYRPGDFLDAHYDRQARKIVTQLFYFNQHWDSNWGGSLHILDPENTNRTLFTIPPIINYSAIFIAKNDAWHSVKKVRSHAEQKRLTMGLQFYVSG